MNRAIRAQDRRSRDRSILGIMIISSFTEKREDSINRMDRLILEAND
ncbi:MAG: hypothetical protein IH840_03065 [Candidatus Heimdallarchaeota archaeon]|nr:hypothetical protein [Candidatus Heimdallarchaeota archaeon]